MARPSKYSEAVIARICDQLSQGTPMAVICREEGMPAYRTVKDWMDEKDSEGKSTERGRFVSAAIACAREEGFDFIAADCLRIADTPMPGRVQKSELLGVMKRRGEDGEEQTVVVPGAELVVTEERVEDMLGHRKLQIDTRLKLLAKWDPKRFGDRVQLADAEGNNLPAPPPFIVMPVAPRGSDE